MKTILCFGDSNTWGFIPGSGQRYDKHTRWPGVLQDTLGPEYQVIENGLNARHSAFDSPFKPFLNGMKDLPSVLWSQKPIDVLVISLGTNDLKWYTAAQAANGVAQLVSYALNMDLRYPSSMPVFTGAPKVLVISPIEVSAQVEAVNPDSDLVHAHDQSLLFPHYFQRMCAEWGVTMLDAQQIAQPSDVDGIHMAPESHCALGVAVADVVQSMLEA